jgi:hypothetical protein
MLGSFHLPTVPGRDVQIFTRLNQDQATNTEWTEWTRPRGLSMAWIFCLGGGAGGGGGFTRASGAGAGGGGGGGSAQASVIVPLELLPELLYIQLGCGGQGVSAGTAESGTRSYVTIYPDNVVTNTLVISGAASPTGGGTGTVAVAGAAGTAGTIPVIASMPLAGFGHFALIAGQNGIIGAAASDTAGGAQTIPTTSVLCMGGGSGAGVSVSGAAGGPITAIASSYLSQYAPAQADPGVSGSGLVQLWKPFFSFCGMGGGSSNASVGGKGGPGAYGSGGGGGGAGTTGGRGGDGGSGIVIISCW